MYLDMPLTCFKVIFKIIETALLPEIYTNQEIQNENVTRSRVSTPDVIFSYIY